MGPRTSATEAGKGVKKTKAASRGKKTASAASKIKEIVVDEKPQSTTKNSTETKTVAFEEPQHSHESYIFFFTDLVIFEK